MDAAGARFAPSTFIALTTHSRRGKWTGELKAFSNDGEIFLLSGGE